MAFKKAHTNTGEREQNVVFLSSSGSWPEHDGKENFQDTVRMMILSTEHIYLWFLDVI